MKFDTLVKELGVELNLKDEEEVVGVSEVEVVPEEVSDEEEVEVVTEPKVSDEESESESDIAS